MSPGKFQQAQVEGGGGGRSSEGQDDAQMLPKYKQQQASKQFSHLSYRFIYLLFLLPAFLSFSLSLSLCDSVCCLAKASCMALQQLSPLVSPTRATTTTTTISPKRYIRNISVPPPQAFFFNQTKKSPPLLFSSSMSSPQISRSLPSMYSENGNRAISNSSSSSSSFVVKSAAAAAAAHTPTTENSNSNSNNNNNNNNNNNKSISDNRMLVFVPPHSLIKHWVSVLRNEQTPPPIFKNAMAELGRLLIYEASRDWLPTVNGEIQSPMGVASVEFIDPREPVVVVPILRAGLALVEHASSILPATKTYHLGIGRNEETLLPSIYLNKLPDKLPEGSRVLVVDPMLATGGTIVAALDLLKDRGVDFKRIKVISAVAAPPALQKLSEKFPGLHVYTGTIDPTVNEKGFIIPGLGDAGDRSFGT